MTERTKPQLPVSRPESDGGNQDGLAVLADSSRADCRRRAMDLLARREHSRVELERKLGSRGFTDITLSATLDDLEQEGLLADHRFAESFIRARAGRGQGPVRILAELGARGVDAAIAAEIIRESGVDWPGLAVEVRIKRFGRDTPAGYLERARQARFLQYRGFEGDQIAAALDQTADFD
jgi:regulatory protein